MTEMTPSYKRPSLDENDGTFAGCLDGSRHVTGLGWVKKGVTAMSASA